MQSLLLWSCITVAILHTEGLVISARERKTASDELCPVTTSSSYAARSSQLHWARQELSSSTTEARAGVTPAPVIVVRGGITLSALPPNICGFVGGDPVSVSMCPDEDATCAIADGSVCCATSGVCPVMSNTTACQDIAITDYADVRYGFASFVMSDRLYCDLEQGLQCHTDQLGTVNATACFPTSITTYWTVVPPQEFSAYFAGYTVEYDYTWNLQALQGGPTRNASIAEVLAPLKEGPPACLASMNVTCPLLWSEMQDCHSASSGGACLCAAYQSNPCPGLCLEGHEPNEYLRYLIPACEALLVDDNNGTLVASNETRPDNWTSLWPDFPNTSDTAYLQLFPWRWRIQPELAEFMNSTNGTDRDFEDMLLHCPTARNALGSFAIVNGVVFVVSILTANRHVIKLVTGGRFGGDTGGRWWPMMALLAVAINLAGNWLNATLTKSKPGYHHVPLWSLVLLWCTRPRLAWLVVLLVPTTEHLSKPATIKCMPKFATKYLSNLGTAYIDSSISALMAEVILQTIGSVYMGLTVNHARSNQFYLLNHLDHTPHKIDALIMYAGALLWFIGMGAVTLRTVWVFTPVGTIVKDALTICGNFIVYASILVVNYALIGAIVSSWVLALPVILLAAWLWTAMCKPTWYWFRHGRFEPQALAINSKWESLMSRSSPVLAPSRTRINRANLQWRESRKPLSASSSLTSSSSKEVPKIPFTTKFQNFLWPWTPMRCEAREKRKTAEAEAAAARAEKSDQELVNEYVTEMGFSPPITQHIVELFWWMALPWACQWLFWIGFVRLARSLYCPPAIWTLMGIWTVFNSLGVLLGTVS